MKRIDFTGGLKSALLITLALGTTALAPLNAHAQDAQAPANSQNQQQPLSAEFRATLQNFGSFVQNARYGEVWKPSVTPESWHPYPACNWVFTQKFGWYFKDDTPWGQIVHHYGRWTNDAEQGWIWVPGAEFSPGWVVWRTSADYIGWAPMMPDADIQQISAESFNKSGQWTFMEAKKFGKSCGDVLPAAQAPLLLQNTTFVTDVRMVDGIGVYVLPPVFVGSFVDIHVNFNAWANWFFAKYVLNLNWVWNNVNIIIVANHCPKDPPKDGPKHPQQNKHPLESSPPPPPGQRGEAPRLPPRFADIPQQPRLPSPPVVDNTPRLPPRASVPFIPDRGIVQQRPSRDFAPRLPRDLGEVAVSRPPRQVEGPRMRAPVRADFVRPMRVAPRAVAFNAPRMAGPRAAGPRMGGNFGGRHFR